MRILRYVYFLLDSPMEGKFVMLSQTLWQRLLRFSIVLCGVLALVCVYLAVANFFAERNVAAQQMILDSKNAELDRIAAMTGFVKFDYVDILQSKVTALSWSDRIQKIVDMIQSIKSIGSQE